MPITQNISQFPLAPQAGTDTPEEFSSKADAFVAHQADAYVGEVNTWAGQANTVQTDVNQNATNAGLSATNANQSAIDASGSASNASDSASSASTSETNAGLSADQASQSATDASTSETNAGNSETNAGISEANALQSATDAETASDSAQASANYTGEWNSGTSYLTGQSVTVDDVFYACKVPNSNLNPPDNPTEWQLSASVTMYAGLGDVTLAGLEDGDCMYWDNVAGFWKRTPNYGIEYVNNTNGHYVKYPDGTLLQYYTATTDPGSIVTKTFPIPFVGQASITLVPYSSAPRTVQLSSSLGTNPSTFQVRGYNDQVQASVNFYWTAMGRWK